MIDALSCREILQFCPLPCIYIVFDSSVDHVTGFNVLFANDAFLFLVGTTLAEIAGKPLFQLKELALMGLEEWVRACKLEEFSLQALHSSAYYSPKTGRYYNVDIFCPEDGSMAIFFQDVSAEKQALEQAEKSSLIIDNLGELFVMTDNNLVLEFVSKPYCALFGQTENELLGRKIEPATHPDDKCFGYGALEQLQAPPYRAVFQTRMLTRAGWRWIEWSAKAIIDESKEIAHLVGVGRDVTDRKILEMELADSRERLEMALYGGGMSTWDWDIENGLVVYSIGDTGLGGYRTETVKVSDVDFWKAKVHPEDIDLVWENAKAHLNSGSSHFETEFRMKLENDDRYAWLLIRGEIIERYPDGRAKRMCGVSLNIDKRKQLEEWLRILATTDPLTGILNRRHLIELVEQEKKRVDRYGGAFTLVMFDIDHFKKINDRFGHEVGDKVLCELASHISSRLRKTDAFARWGGEEFIVLLTDTSISKAVGLVEGLFEVFADISLKFGWDVTASFGVTQYRKEDSVDELLRRVDGRMYNAKASGRNCIIYG